MRKVKNMAEFYKGYWRKLVGGERVGGSDDDK